MHKIFIGLVSAASCLFSVTLASYGGYGGGFGPYNYGYGYSGLAFPYIPYGYHGAKFLTEVKAAKLRGALYDGHPSRYAQFGGHGFVGYPDKAKLDYSLNGVPNAGYGYGGGDSGPSFFDGRSNVAAADDKTAAVAEAPIVDAGQVPLAPVGGGVGGLASPYASDVSGRLNEYPPVSLYGGGNGGAAAGGGGAGSQAPMGAGYGGQIDPYALYGRYMGPYSGGYAQKKTAFGPSGGAYY